MKQNKHLVYDKIKTIGLLSSDKNSLEYWGLPLGICEQFKKHTKVSKLFDWQAECLGKSKAVLSGQKNLVYFAPTSGTITE